MFTGDTDDSSGVWPEHEKERAGSRRHHLKGNVWIMLQAPIRQEREDVVLKTRCWAKGYL